VVVVAPPALPTASAPAPAASPVLVRDEPWPAPSEASDAAQLIVATPVPPELRGDAASDGHHPSVSVSSVVSSAGISNNKVKVTLAHVPLDACYQLALKAHPSGAPFDAELRLNIDVGGRIANAVLSRDGNLPGLRGCFEAVLRLAQVRDVGTGEGSATALLRFSPR
jgi:hypothetical protein